MELWSMIVSSCSDNANQKPTDTDYNEREMYEHFVVYLDLYAGNGGWENSLIWVCYHFRDFANKH